MATPEQIAREERQARVYGLGLPARRAAVDLLTAVIERRQPLSEALERSPASALMLSLPERDRGLARAIASTALRRRGEIDAVLARLLDKPLTDRAKATYPILLALLAQLLFMGIAPHAAISLAVRQAQGDRRTRAYDKLVNAVARRAATEGSGLVAELDAPRLDTPDWLWSRWVSAFGEPTARRIGAAHLIEAPLDLTVKSDPDGWARRLNGMMLPTGSVRLRPRGRIDQLDGFGEGEWWVQDAAAALPARLLGDIRGKRVADLCAAPGGKTAQLAQMGAEVTAVDRSGERLRKVADNLERLGLAARLVEADAVAWRDAQPFDAVLLDAPCSATGTIRRHPDIPWLKGPGDVAELADLQRRLLDNAVSLLRPGGLLVYCACSLEAEECGQQAAALLRRTPGLAPKPIHADEVDGSPDWVDTDGHLRTFPFHLPHPDPEWGGMDGFFAARFRAV